MMCMMESIFVTGGASKRPGSRGSNFRQYDLIESHKLSINCYAQ